MNIIRRLWKWINTPPEWEWGPEPAKCPKCRSTAVSDRHHQDGDAYVTTRYCTWCKRNFTKREKR